MHVASRAHPVDHDPYCMTVRCSVTLLDCVHGPQNTLGDTACGRHLHQLRFLAGFHSTTQLFTGPVLRRQGEAIRCFTYRRSRHLHHMKTTRKVTVPVRRCLFVNLLKCFREGGTEMHFVQDHQTVVPRQACMNGLHTRPNPVAAKQQPRTKLIHRRNHNPRPIGLACPLVVQRNSAP